MPKSPLGCIASPANRCIDILRRRKPTTDIEAIAEPADERENIEAAQMEADRNRQLRAALSAP
jgi:hypothetical protein